MPSRSDVIRGTWQVVSDATDRMLDGRRFEPKVG